MRIAFLKITNFRGISKAKIYLNAQTVIIGDNNAGKSTIFEAIDLVLGPDRLNRVPVIDEHDFYNGVYQDLEENSPKIEIELIIVGLDDTQVSRFKYHLEFWDTTTQRIIGPNEVDEVDEDYVIPALRLRFEGSYDAENDDFAGETIFCAPEKEGDAPFHKFSRSDKRECGFLYLRALRTGARALSMERGSLLDVILRIRDIRPKMWEHVLQELRETDVAVDPGLGIKAVLEGIQEALKEFVPSDWGSEPILRVSDLTREHLRKTLTIFMSTGAGTYHAPFQHQGTGTINTMVLALLSMIAEAKQNVIFAMEEPETAIPPYTQKRIIHSIIHKSAQAIFTSHSPFILEEFAPENILLVQRSQKGKVKSQAVKFPSTIKPKNYNTEFRMRFSEALLAKRVLLAEGTTEATSYAAAGRRLSELSPETYSSLEAMGIAVFDVMSDSSIAPYGDYFKELGKTVFAVFDKQDAAARTKISTSVQHPFESEYKGFEVQLIKELPDNIIKEFYNDLLVNKEWPTHLDKYKPAEAADADDFRKAVRHYLQTRKGAHTAAELLGRCKSAKQVPDSIRKVFIAIKDIVDPKTP